MKLHTRQLVAGLALTLVLSALSAPSAFASRPDDRALHGVGAISVGTAIPDAFERAASRAAASTPDVVERAVYRNQLQVPAAIPDAFERKVVREQVSRPDDRGIVRGPGAFSPPQSVGIASGERFDVSWSSSLIALAAGVCLLLVLSAVLATRRRNRMALR